MTKASQERLTKKQRNKGKNIKQNKKTFDLCLFILGMLVILDYICQCDTHLATGIKTKAKTLTREKQKAGKFNYDLCLHVFQNEPKQK